MRKAILLGSVLLALASTSGLSAAHAATDTAPPVVTFDKSLLFGAGSALAGSDLSATAQPTFVGWAMSDLSGICQESGYSWTDQGSDSNGQFQAPPLVYRLSAPLMSSYDTVGADLHMKDCAANVGDYSHSYSGHAGDDDGAAIYSSATTWKTSTCTCFAALNGATITDRNSTTVGDTASYRYYGNSVALVAPTAPGRGTAKIFIDGVDHGNVSFASSTARNRVLVFTWYQDTTGYHTLQVKVLSGRVDIDAFLRD